MEHPSEPLGKGASRTYSVKSNDAHSFEGLSAKQQVAGPRLDGRNVHLGDKPPPGAALAPGKAGNPINTDHEIDQRMPEVQNIGLDSTTAAAIVKDRILGGAGDLESLLAYVRSGHVK